MTPRKPRLLRNSAWGIVATGLPLVAVIAFVPVLLRELGAERFGLLSLIFAVLAYATALNFGLGKAITQRLSATIAAGDNDQDICVSVWSATAAQLVFGSIGGVALYLLAGPITSMLMFSDDYRSEALASLQLLAIALPLALMTTTFRGLLQASGHFNLIASVDAPAGILLYSLPALAVVTGGGIPTIVTYLIASRLAAFFAYVGICIWAIRAMRRRPRVSIAVLRQMMSFGIWVAISDAVLPIFAYIDRFIIGAALGVSAITKYSIPQDVINRLWMFPTGVVNAVFPAASAIDANHHHEAFRALYQKSSRLLTATIFAGAGLCALFSYDVFAIWISPTFATDVAPLFRIFLVGLVINSISMLGSSLLLSQGLARLRASILLVEIPGYFVALAVLIPTLGVEGAAWAWVIRMLITFVCVQYFVGSRLHLGLPLGGSLSHYWTTTVALALFVYAATVGFDTGIVPRLVIATGMTVLAMYVLSSSKKESTA